MSEYKPLKIHGRIVSLSANYVTFEIDVTVQNKTEAHTISSRLQICPFEDFTIDCPEVLLKLKKIRRKKK